MSSVTEVVYATNHGRDRLGWSSRFISKVGSDRIGRPDLSQLFWPISWIFKTKVGINQGQSGKVKDIATLPNFRLKIGESRHWPRFIPNCLKHVLSWDRPFWPDPTFGINRDGLPNLDLNPTQFWSRYYPLKISRPFLYATFCLAQFCTNWEASLVGASSSCRHAPNPPRELHIQPV